MQNKKYINMKEKLISQLRRSNNPLIVYGAGTAGTEIVDVCHKNYIGITAFCDDNPALHNKKVNGLPVYPTHNIKRYFPNAEIIISLPMLYRIKTLMHTLGLSSCYRGGILFSTDKGWGGSKSYRLEKKHRIRRMTFSSHSESLSKETFRINDISIFITEKCTLQCINCSQRIPYYKQSTHYELNEILFTIDNLLSYVDEIGVFSIVGGEPLLHPDWDKIAQRIISSEKVQILQIITNGTIVPSLKSLSILSHEKCVVLISKYEGAKQKIEELSDNLCRSKVYHYIHHYKKGTWTRRLEPVYFQRTAEENLNVYLNCILRNCFTIASGKLFMCTFALSNYNINFDNISKDDYVDIDKLAADQVDIVTAQKLIENYINKYTPLKICNYCAPQLRGDFTIVPGEQLNIKKS